MVQRPLYLILEFSKSPPLDVYLHVLDRITQALELMYDEGLTPDDSEMTVTHMTLGDPHHQHSIIGEKL